MNDGDGETTYEEYLGLDDLLTSGEPAATSDDLQVRTAESFFIVCHQVSELWLKQALEDIELAVETAEAPPHDLDQAAAAVHRAAAVVRLLAENVAVLRMLAPQEFAAFRPDLGSMSGADSDQFRRLRDVLGLLGDESPLTRVLRATVREHRTTLTAAYSDGHGSGGVYRLAEAMTELSQAYWSWQVVHIEIVRRSLGGMDGTGGSSGQLFLLDRLHTPFPELWEARTNQHRPALGCPPE